VQSFVASANANAIWIVIGAVMIVATTNYPKYVLLEIVTVIDANVIGIGNGNASASVVDRAIRSSL
jgi:hypothetical protein